jgi:hypothetical protein
LNIHKIIHTIQTLQQYVKKKFGENFSHLQENVYGIGCFSDIMNMVYLISIKSLTIVFPQFRATVPLVQKLFFVDDHSLVQLKPLSGSGKRGEYINASYIDGYQRARTFIAAQAKNMHNIEHSPRIRTFIAAQAKNIYYIEHSPTRPHLHHGSGKEYAQYRTQSNAPAPSSRPSQRTYTIYCKERI